MGTSHSKASQSSRRPRPESSSDPWAGYQRIAGPPTAYTPPQLRGNQPPNPRPLYPPSQPPNPWPLYPPSQQQHGYSYSGPSTRPIPSANSMLNSPYSQPSVQMPQNCENWTDVQWTNWEQDYVSQQEQHVSIQQAQRSQQLPPAGMERHGRTAVQRSYETDYESGNGQSRKCQEAVSAWQGQSQRLLHVLAKLVHHWSRFA
ncbi:hypothetical protein K402DRAFT_454106 [Aulographum hederae CBS 113979]|uniref:Uncharacterized protein n=1 Tax=Aulographum hederae CBS 113979 TaxID=1176131 RepID=A0A6G1H1D9_9PEZI|nr:hypothetical protein K402DRAFT_454106 [Aulographum hederae CBS 113979]